MLACQASKKSSPYGLPLFASKKEWRVFLGTLAVLFCLNLFALYEHHRAYQTPQNQELIAKVKSQYIKEKNHKKYFVLRLEDSKHQIFYTAAPLDIKELVNERVRLYGRMRACSFWESLRSCYFASYSLARMPTEGVKPYLREWVARQHADPRHASLFQALFFADGLDREYRKLANLLGISHLIAISGFHLGLLSGLLFLLLLPLYGALQRRYFPYRNRIFDLSALVLLCMAGYLVLLDFQASFLRAYLMSAFAYVLYVSGVEILSFSAWGILGGIALACFPRLLFDVGFILSMGGVFYILLFVRHFEGLRRRLVGLVGAGIFVLLFNVCIFLLMGVLVHFYFPYFSPYQFASILLSIAFVGVFPLVIFLHLLGLGGVFDPLLDRFITLDLTFIEFSTPAWLLGGYVLLSLGAVYERRIFYLLLGASAGFSAYLCYLFWAIGV